MSSASQFGTLITVDSVAPVGGNVAFTSTGGTITITRGVGTIDFEAVGGGGGGITTIDGDVGSVTGTTITLTGGTSGAVFTGSGTTMTESFQFLSLPDSTTTSLGVIDIGGDSFLSAYPGLASFNTQVGAQAGGFSNISVYTGTSNTLVGYRSGYTMSSGSSNCAMGTDSLNNVGSGSANICIGELSGTNYVSVESNNICLGSTGVTGENNVMRLGIGTSFSDPTTTYIGGINGNSPSGTALLTYIDTTGQISSAGEVLIPDTTSSSIGVLKINSVPFLHAFPGTASNNVFVGENAGNFSVSGTDNTIIGHAAGASITSDNTNVLIGNSCGTAMAGSSGSNVGVGHVSLVNLTTGGSNCAFGTNSLDNVITGSQNIGVGFAAGNSWTGAEESSILIGSNGVSGDTNVMRLGDDTRYAITSTFVGGVFGVTVTGSAVLMASDGQMGTIASSERYKENIEDLSDTDVLSLRPVSFNYKSRPGQPQAGLIAEEVDKIMPGLVVRGKEGQPESVMYHELPVLLLNEIKKMSSRISVLEKQLAACKK